MTTRWGALGAAVALALLLLLTPTVSTPARAQMGPPLDQLTGDDFDKAFLQQMTMHHAMAVMMAGPAVANSSRQELKDLAQTIIDSQAAEIDTMNGWLSSWYSL